MTAANDFLMSGGSTSAKFPTPGTTVTGTICRPPEVQQQRDFTTGEPKFWDDGKPMQQLQVQLQTSEKDMSVPDDDGVAPCTSRARCRRPSGKPSARPARPA
jgi:hypothetical protein